MNATGKGEVILTIKLIVLLVLKNLIILNLLEQIPKHQKI